ncbi:putative transferase [Helianthus debilis subsp. tardiflorus]
MRRKDSTNYHQTLTKYYPFAGRHANIAPTYVDCNDHGAEFIEASIDGVLSDFLQHWQHGDLDQLFPNERTWNNSNRGDQDLQSDDPTSN